MKVALDIRTQPPVLLIYPSSNDEAHTLRIAGAAWMKQHPCYATTHLDLLESVAAKLGQSISSTLSDKLRAAYAKTEAWSAAADASLVSPDLQLKLLDLYPFQRAGAACILGRRATLLADEMGLGKTAQVSVALRILAGRADSRFLVVCPASLKRWWADEIERWSGIQSIEILSGKNKNGSVPRTATVWIVNYDVVGGYEQCLTEIHWDACILDEAHLVKNPKAIRTQVICGDRDHPGLRARHRIALTGTPILNYPAEMFSILRWLDPIGWPRKREFQLRYCDAHFDHFGVQSSAGPVGEIRIEQTPETQALFPKRLPAVRVKGVWNTRGASHLEELNMRLRRTVMVRRMKSEVLESLPEKTRQVLLIDPDEATKRVVQIQAEWMKGLGISASTDAYERLIEAKVHFEEISRMRKELADAKIGLTAEHVEEALEQKEKVVLFAHHRVLIDAISARFKCSVRLAGDTALEERNEAVRRFQEDPKCRLFVGSIQAAGTGITLTSSDLCIFAELDWVPANMLQAEARLHRIGQKRNVQVQYLVVNESIDARVVHALVDKIHVIERTLGKAVV